MKNTLEKTKNNRNIRTRRTFSPLRRVCQSRFFLHTNLHLILWSSTLQIHHLTSGETVCYGVAHFENLPNIVIFYSVKWSELNPRPCPHHATLPTSLHRAKTALTQRGPRPPLFHNANFGRQVAQENGWRLVNFESMKMAKDNKWCLSVCLIVCLYVCNVILCNVMCMYIYIYMEYLKTTWHLHAFAFNLYIISWHIARRWKLPWVNCCCLECHVRGRHRTSNKKSRCVSCDMRHWWPWPWKIWKLDTPKSDVNRPICHMFRWNPSNCHETWWNMGIAPCSDKARCRSQDLPPFG